ncbi:hypothetical protein ACFVXA_12410 [Streptomyces sp. NPDC058246]|uniref:hypothetical protein n=1 Tax=Streptomyces sp. NPDC058246 TaxID=3346400 RepID=UPI0036E4FB2F
MEIAKLVLEYAKVFVWPAFFGLLAWRFGINFASLIDRLKSAETPAGTFNFNDQATKLDQQLQEEQAREGDVAEPAPLTLPGLHDPRALVNVSPEAAVLLAHRAMELTARHAAEAVDPEPDARRFRPFTKILESLVSEGLSQNVYSIARQLQRMRAEINHEGVSVSRSAAEEFVAACEFVTGKITDLVPSADDWTADVPSQSQLDREMGTISTEGL